MTQPSPDPSRLAAGELVDTYRHAIFDFHEALNEQPFDVPRLNERMLALADEIKCRLTPAPVAPADRPSVEHATFEAMRLVEGYGLASARHDGSLESSKRLADAYHAVKEAVESFAGSTVHEANGARLLLPEDVAELRQIVADWAEGFYRTDALDRLARIVEEGGGGTAKGVVE